MAKQYLFTFVAICALTSVSTAQEPREEFEVEISASVDEVWKAFTTTEGLKSWVAPLADIELKVGGKWRANYKQDGRLGDANTIENTIIAYDPKRMLSLKATGFPEGFPFEEAAKSCWTVFYFTPVSETKTKINVVGLGYTDTEQSKQMRSFFEAANKYSMDQLEAEMKKQATKDEWQDTGSGTGTLGLLAKFKIGDLVPCPERQAEFTLTATAKKDNVDFYQVTQSFCYYKDDSFDPTKEPGTNSTESNISDLVGGSMFGNHFYSKLSPTSASIQIDWKVSLNKQNANFKCEFEIPVGKHGTKDLGEGKTIAWSFAPVVKD